MFYSPWSPTWIINFNPHHSPRHDHYHSEWSRYVPFCTVHCIYLKLFLEQTISTKLCDLLHMFCWFVCTKTKVTTTSEWQSSYNQNNLIILMKFNKNNVGIEENFQVSSFTAFRLNNLMSTNICDTTVKNQSICLFPRHDITRDDPSSS